MPIKKTDIEKKIQQNIEQSSFKKRFSRPKNTKQCVIRMPEYLFEDLSLCFSEKGIPVSTGIRMVLVDFLRNEKNKS